MHTLVIEFDSTGYAGDAPTSVVLDDRSLGAILPDLITEHREVFSRSDSADLDVLHDGDAVELVSPHLGLTHRLVPLTTEEADQLDMSAVLSREVEAWEARREAFIAADRPSTLVQTHVGDGTPAAEHITSRSLAKVVADYEAAGHTVTRDVDEYTFRLVVAGSEPRMMIHLSPIPAGITDIKAASYDATLLSAINCVD